jgi:hypothetical protein
MVEKETDLMACDGDGVEFEITGQETVYCKGCANCKPREEVTDE